MHAEKLGGAMTRGCALPCYTGSCSEVYLEKAFDNTSFRPRERLPVAKELGETSLMFLVHPTLTDAEIKKTCQVIHEVLEKALTSTKESSR
jgi:dTDP-4-amino-4,6-dideoxygalactose transaminase